MEERMIKRVETLLQQAEGFRRHGEDGSADAALNIAEQIMIKWSIDQSMLWSKGDVDATHEAVVQLRVPFTGIYRQAVLSGMYGVADAFGTVRVFRSVNGNVTTLHVIGYASDVTQLKLLFASLQLQVMDAMNRWWHNFPQRAQVKGMLGYKTRRTFIVHFMEGVIERVQRSRQASVDDSGSALVVVERRRIVDAYMDANFELTSSRSRSKTGLAVAADAGLEAGRRAATGETTVNGGQRLLTR